MEHAAGELQRPRLRRCCCCCTSMRPTTTTPAVEIDDDDDVVAVTIAAASSAARSAQFLRHLCIRVTEAHRYVFAAADTAEKVSKALRTRKTGCGCHKKKN